MNNVEIIIEELKKFSEEIIELKGFVEASLVEAFESKYHLTLPTDYKQLLNYTNGFSLMGVGVLGLTGDENQYGLEMAYHIEHHQVENPQPKYLVPFHNDGRGNHYCFDTRTIDQFSCKIVFWQWDLDYTLIEPEIVSDSLMNWIKEEVIDWTLEDYNYDGSNR